MRAFSQSGISPAGEFFRSRCARSCACGLFAAIVALAGAPLWAQAHKVIKPRINDKAAKAMVREVNLAIRNPAGFGADETKVQDYFMKYYFPKMTGTAPEQLAELGDMRDDLFRRYIRATPNPQSQATLTGWALKVATALAQGNYHPAVRYNAALILGDLDQQISDGQNPPVPLPAATVVLLDLLEQNDFDGVTVHPSVKMGALVGLERHARYGIAPEYADRLNKAALDVMAQDEPPEDVSKGIHQWMKYRAASVLAWQNRQKPDAKTMSTLNALMSDDAFDLDNRVYVAGLLERMEFQQAVDLDAPAVTSALGKLSQDVLKAESKLARDYQREIVGNRNIDFGRMRRGGLRDVDNLPKYERRRLYNRLRNIFDADSQLLKADLPAGSKKQLEDLSEAMKPARLAAADKDSTDLDIAQAVIAASQAVDQLVQSWNAGGETAAAPDGDPLAGG